MPVRAAPADKTGYSICRDAAGDLEAMQIVDAEIQVRT
jgi:hypothetical protein